MPEYWAEEPTSDDMPETHDHIRERNRVRKRMLYLYEWWHEKYIPYEMGHVFLDSDTKSETRKKSKTLESLRGELNEHLHELIKLRGYMWT